MWQRLPLVFFISHFFSLNFLSFWLMPTRKRPKPSNNSAKLKALIPIKHDLNFIMGRNKSRLPVLYCYLWRPIYTVQLWRMQQACNTPYSLGVICMCTSQNRVKFLSLSQKLAGFRKGILLHSWAKLISASSSERVIFALYSTANFALYSTTNEQQQLRPWLWCKKTSLSFPYSVEIFHNIIHIHRFRLRLSQRLKNVFQNMF